MNQDEHKIVVRRMAGLIAAASVLIAVYVLRLIFLQLVNSDSFKAQATNTTDYNFTVTAARGDIVDSAGRRIAASTTSYNVVLSKLLMGDEDLDAMLQLMEERDGNSCDPLPGEMEALLDNRNKAWVEKMPTIMTEAPTLFVVGAGHLPGSNGVLNLLKGQGYTIEAMK